MSDKHGFQNLPLQTLKSWYARQGKTMLRTCAAVRHTGGLAPAHVLSLDFYRWQFNPLGSIRQSEQNHAYRTYYPPIAAADHPSSKPSKHGVCSGNASAPRGSGWRFPNTMLRTYAAHICMNAHPPALLPITLKPTFSLPPRFELG